MISNIYLYTFFIAMVPVIELRGAIPIGVSLGLSHIEAFIVSFIGSIIPISFVIYLFRPVASTLRNTFLKKFFDKIEKAIKNGEYVKRLGLFGLFLFVAIPLPGTGIYSGSLIAAFLNIRLKHALTIIACGNFVAGLIVMILTYGIGRIF